MKITGSGQQNPMREKKLRFFLKMLGMNGCKCKKKPIIINKCLVKTG
jgi:hypothetical protein